MIFINQHHSLLRVAIVAALASCASCAVGPNYVRPEAASSAAYKEAPDGWAQAAPADAQDKGDWWTLFNDPILNDLEQRVAVSNQNIAAAAAAYAQARALIREQRGEMFPTIDLSADAARSRSSASSNLNDLTAGGTSNTTNNGTTGGTIRNNYQVEIGASWELDVWGRIRRTVENAKANAQASAADLANATLSAQGELASDYWQLRETDAELALVRATVEGYQRSLQIAQNRYDVRIATKADLLQAQTQLATTQAELAGLEKQRAQLEHAIAVLVGESPANFSLAAEEWNASIPAVPASLPSDLLQRRPDIAAAERRVAAANAQIGVATAAFFPTLSLTGALGSSASELGNLFNASSYIWSAGASTVETLFAGGAKKAAVDEARAAYDSAVAEYRQTVLEAFAGVEDQLVGLRVLDQQYQLRQQASAAADETEQLSLNQYRAGLISYTDVVTVQATALSARTALVQAARDRQTTTVALIQALGGGWRADTLAANK